MRERIRDLFQTTPLAVAATAILALGFAPSADAAFIAYICNDAQCTGGNDRTAIDDGTNDDADMLPGLIDLTGYNFHGFAVTVNMSQSKPLLESGMDLNFTVTDTSGLGGTVWLYATDTDFTGGPTNYTASIGGTADSGNVRAVMCGGDSNVQFQTSPCQFSSTLEGPGSFSEDFGLLTTTADPYSLLIGVQVVLAANGTTTGDFRVDRVPAPASLALFGLGLMGFGLRRKKH